jgi:hypothetical protein
LLKGLKTSPSAKAVESDIDVIKTNARTKVGVRLRERISKMKNWRVGTLQPTSDRVGNPTGSGFVLYDETGQPCVTFGYGSEKDARVGREHVEAALANVASVEGR